MIAGIRSGSDHNTSSSADTLGKKWSAKQAARMRQDRFRDTGKASRYPPTVDDGDAAAGRRTKTKEVLTLQGLTLHQSVTTSNDLLSVLAAPDQTPHPIFALRRIQAGPGEGRTAREILKMVISEMSTLGHNNILFATGPLLVFSPRTRSRAEP